MPLWATWNGILDLSYIYGLRNVYKVRCAIIYLIRPISEAWAEILDIFKFVFWEIWILLINHINILEIKPALGSRIRDMEAELRLKIITDVISWWIFGKQNWRFRMNLNVELKCQSVHQDMTFLTSNSLHNLEG